MVEFEAPNGLRSHYGKDMPESMKAFWDKAKLLDLGKAAARPN